ncbi:MAG: hypothetical protein JW844_05250 [Candidatus Omnitrophica bacterium]|nr:hypothetical protein [Candidatus Omnitrophota bacterium]
MKTLLRDNRGFSIMITMVVIMMLATLAFTSMSLFVTDTHITQEECDSTQAFYLAAAGVECALEEALSGEGNWNWSSGLTKTMNEGSFTVYFTGQSVSTVTINSTGTCNGKTRKIGCSLKRSPGELPEAFHYAIHAGNTVNMNSSEGIIDGSVSSTEGTIHEGEMEILGEVTPYSGVSLPLFDFTGYYRDTPPEHRMTEGFTFESGQTYSGLWYIDGNAYVEDNVTIEGSVICTGNINLAQSEGITIIPTKPYPAIMTAQNIIATNLSNSYIEGLVYAAGDVNNNLLNHLSNVEFFGCLCAGNTFNMNNAENVRITYDPEIGEIGVLYCPESYGDIEPDDNGGAGWWREEY